MFAQVYVPEAKSACGTTQLVGGLEASIEGAIHVVRVLFEEHRKEEDWGFLLVDARNAFNEKNRTAMLWAPGMSGPVARSLLLTATATGPRWCSGT